MGFNSRTREGATNSFNYSYSDKGFNSRTREGATPNITGRRTKRVSIHAPVKVRPGLLRGELPGIRVSIHAPVKVRH